MKRSELVKSTRKRSTKRNLFAELSEGMEALADARKGKRTLRTHVIHLRRRNQSDVDKRTRQH